VTRAGVLDPGAWLGVIGGGQLGRMFCAAAQNLGFQVCVLDPDPQAPAAAVADEHLQAGYDDAAGLVRLAARCGAVTTEFENVPAESLRALARDVRVTPAAEAVAIAQDRIGEKAFLAGIVEVAPYAVIRGEADLDAVAADLYPGILKAARLGYDGKGQVRVANAAEALAGWRALGAVDCVLEQRLDLKCELSVVVARAGEGSALAYPVAENEHRDGVLAVSIVPARIESALAERAQAAALEVAERLGYVGVLCVEFFVAGAPGSIGGPASTQRLLANEIAPRPHNSGHYSIEACVASQFEQQVRILAGLPLGEARQMQPAVMLNLLGDLWFDGAIPRTPPFSEALAIPGACLHLYRKREARRGRKMGHLTLLAPTLEVALARAASAAGRLGIPLPPVLAPARGTT
jgi:5-(carboxyamino)imidazole ribonucleotide synthase